MTVNKRNIENYQNLHSFKKNFIYYLFIYFWLRWVFVADHRLSLVAASGGYSWLRCAGSSLRWLLLLQSTGSRAQSQQLWHVGSRAQSQQLWRTGLVAPWKTRARTRVPCIDRWIPNHCTTREAQNLHSLQGKCQRSMCFPFENLVESTVGVDDHMDRLTFLCIKQLAVLSCVHDLSKPI